MSLRYVCDVCGGDAPQRPLPWDGRIPPVMFTHNGLNIRISVTRPSAPNIQATSVSSGGAFEVEADLCQVCLAKAVASGRSPHIPGPVTMETKPFSEITAREVVR